MPLELSESDGAWLAELDERCNETVEARGIKIESPRDVVLTAEEWHRVRQLVFDHELPCLPWTQWGFQHAIAVYDHAPVPGVSNEHLLSLHAQHLPDYRAWRAEAPQTAGARAWEEFSALTHSDRNVEVVRFYGLPEPQARDRYTY